MKKIKKLFANIENIEIKGSKEVDILGVTSDSRSCFPSTLFIAKKGERFDGNNFIYDAVKAGAKAIVTDIYDPFLKDITQIITSNVKDIEADIAAKYYDYPAKELFSIGITGTNGKTTTSYLIKHIFDNFFDKKCGIIGSLGCFTGSNFVKSTLTTPQSVALQKYLREMKNASLDSFCMEVSSIGIDQNRIKNISFDVAIFTNLTQDHLDYHKTFENYKNAKKKLFDSLKEDSFLIANIDDKNSYDLIKDSKAKVLKYSTKIDCDLKAENIKYDLLGTSFDLIYKNETFSFFSSLVGSFNVYNILAAVAVGILKKIPMNDLVKSIKTFKNIPGRLERVLTNKPYHIFVDSCHTDDALENVLYTLSQIKNKKIITVFGCGGDRDRSKRPLMAKTAEKYSDQIIVTSDNPRSEDPQKIIDEIKLGFSNNCSYMQEVNRFDAIKLACKMAQKEDIILIAGKGHETYQIFDDKIVDFDDRKISKDIANNL
ncbi:MAG: UDP-N-acetylmuramoyl-L-alanyl-D-glutamate--2,6-diaminopimelate ligase [Parachlamydiales bacterium]|nr:UDP-N-acetylmuramoyl-L-alanyl-D-glutamate--2,6-diaminopimelate ligase [Parachlamydiales bacterium]